MALRKENAELRGRIEALEAKLGQDSSNSSKPPSSDPPGVKRKPPKAKRGRKRKRGGQPGHEGAQRELLPPEKVSRFRDVRPKRCACCEEKLSGDDTEPVRHQVLEVPPVEPDVTEYRLHALECERCGAVTRAELPDGVPKGAYGPRLCAMVAWMTAVLRAPKRAVPVVLQDWFNVPMCLGSVCNIERRVSRALEAPVEEAAEYVRQQAVVHPDETGWREDKKKAWLWVAVTSLVTVFAISRSRGSKVAKRLLGETFSGVAVSDRWSGYSWLKPERRQLCWSHLERDFQFFVDHGGKRGRHIGNGLLKQARKMFRLWHRIRDGTLSRAEFRKKMQPIQREVASLLECGATSATAKVQGTCKEILKLKRALWTFVNIEGVEPTNNAAERAVRHGVLWRKSCFGTDSTHGSRYAERMLTAAATLRQQQRNVLDYLTAAVAASFAQTPAPSLLPV